MDFKKIEWLESTTPVVFVEPLLISFPVMGTRY